jgi:putative nucleotidyltransferase with HDIG domain
MEMSARTGTAGVLAANFRVQVERVNKGLWLVLSLFVIAAMLDSLVASQRMLLDFYTLPTSVSAYLYGRRHATLAALASALLVALMRYFNPTVMGMTLGGGVSGALTGQEWMKLTVWGGTLMVTAYLMGSLYEHIKDTQLTELRETYHGILVILRHSISKDKYTENHSYRVSVYATKIAAQLELDRVRIEDIRASALLHDIGKIDVSKQILYEAARLTESEFTEMQKHVEKGIALLEPVGGSLRRILPIILSHHDKFDGSGYHPATARKSDWRRALSRWRTYSTHSRAIVPIGKPCRRSRCVRFS